MIPHMTLTPEENKKLAELLFPEITKTPEDYFALYPMRNLPKGAEVTRFAPSPTGFLHIGGIFAAIVSQRIAQQSNGVFFLRIEDTDKKREIEGSAETLYQSLTDFGIAITEGYGTNIGDYGPYKQSEREEIYKTFTKSLVEKGMAYPCFCTSEDLEKMRMQQQSEKALPGYYGKWAKYRDQSFAEIKANLESKKEYVVRFRSPGTPDTSFSFDDLVKGTVSVTENTNDIPLIKSTGLPTYHLAHVIDDFLMRTTIVVRGDEWLSSLPVHLQLFEALELTPPQFAHISPILKSENGNKRKLSKRKDPEASVDYYTEKGYPQEAVTEYLLNIANSRFEDWRKENPETPHAEFSIELSKMSKSGALFNLDKLNDISKDIISRMSTEKVYDYLLAWSAQYSESFHQLLVDEKEYCQKIISIERGGEKPRKDIAFWEEAPQHFMYFFDDFYTQEAVAQAKEIFNEMSQDYVQEILKAYSQQYDETLSQDEWFPALREFAESNGFASNMKEYKANPDQFKGNVGDVAMMLRVALTGQKRTPDLYQMMQALGKERVIERLQSMLK